MTNQSKKKSALETVHSPEEFFQDDSLTSQLQKFSEIVRDVDADDFWSCLMQTIAEVIRAGSVSLLVFDEKTDKLIVVAATGEGCNILKSEDELLGESVQQKILLNGEPLIVKNIEESVYNAASRERNYKSNSFICYPIIIGNRRIGVFNIADRIDGGVYDKSDLELLDAIMPLLAVIIDRAVLKKKASEFERLSLVDDLTGLLNRRYLEQRLAEEIERSNRYGFPLSFMMIDVDDFKSYNDNFSHPAGDNALQIIGKSLKQTTRGADVAARYGGDEFSVLLPQTTTDEAEIIARRIRKKIEETEFPQRKITISVGIASYTQLICTTQKIIAAADAALYEAKRKGRNNVQVYEKLK